MTQFHIEGKQIIATHVASGERTLKAVCEDPKKALAMMLKGWELNNKRKYTASARKLAECETLPGFAWVDKALNY